MKPDGSSSSLLRLGEFKEEMTMSGRYPAGPEYVDQLDGSTEAKRRAKVILQTLHGDVRVQDACRLLDICPQRFHQLREEMLQAAVARLEARPVGRPRRAAEPADVHALKEQLAAQELELRVAHLREEIALAMPQVVARPAAPPAPEKKTPRRTRSRARPGAWQK
jgi:transposase-like protein